MRWFNKLVNKVTATNDDEPSPECGTVKPGSNGRNRCTQEKGHQDLNSKGENLHVDYDNFAQWNTPA